MNKEKKKVKGVQVSISPKAHEILSRSAFNSKPRSTLREQVNILLDLSKDE
jgi:hypothetical protein